MRTAMRGLEYFADCPIHSFLRDLRESLTLYEGVRGSESEASRYFGGRSNRHDPLRDLRKKQLLLKMNVHRGSSDDKSKNQVYQRGWIRGILRSVWRHLAGR